MNRTHPNRFRVRSKLGGSILLLTALFFAALLSLGGQGFVAQAQTYTPTTLYVKPNGEWDTTVQFCPSIRSTAHYKTIQGAIDCAQDGDTISIEAGTYRESNIKIIKQVRSTYNVAPTGSPNPFVKPTDFTNIKWSLKIIGESGVIIAPANNATEDSNLDNTFGTTAYNGFVIQSNDVIIDNLAIDGKANNTYIGAGANATTPATTPSTKSNFRNGIVTADSAGTADQTAGYSGITIQNVTIQNVYRTGIRVFLTGSENKISTNTIKDVGLKCGITLLWGNATNAGSPEISSNTISNVHCGISVNDDPTTTNSPKVTIKSNYITLLGTAAKERGLNLFNLAGGSYIGGLTTADGNTITTKGYDSDSAITGIQLAAVGDLGVGILLQKTGIGTVTIQNNSITAKNADAGIWLYGGSGTPKSPIIVDGNTLLAISSQENTSSTGTGTGCGIFVTDNGATFGLAATESAPSYTTIRGNTITGFAFGIDLLGNATTRQTIDSTIGRPLDGTGSTTDANTIDGGATDTNFNNNLRDGIYVGGGSDRTKTLARINYNTVKGYDRDSGLPSKEGKGIDVESATVLVQNTFFKDNDTDVKVADAKSVVDLGDVGPDNTASTFSTTYPNKPGYTGLGQSVGCNVFGVVPLAADINSKVDAENNWNAGTVGLTNFDNLPGNTNKGIAGGATPTSLADIPATCNMVGGFVWQDDNGDSILNSSEGWLKTWQNSTPPASTDVGETWDDTSTSAGPPVVTANDGIWQAAETWNDANTSTSPIAATAGKRDQGNTKGVTGVDVTLWKLNTSTSKYDKVTTKTSNYGYYFFPNQASGTYSVTFDLPSYAKRTTGCSTGAFPYCPPSPPSYTFTQKLLDSDPFTKTGSTDAVLVQGGSYNEFDAGLKPLTVIKGLVWYDANNNGTYADGADNTEQGVGNVKVELLNSAGNAVLTTTTSNVVAPLTVNSSNYVFTVSPGTYNVRITRPGPGWTTTHARPATGYIFDKYEYATTSCAGAAADTCYKSAATPSSDNTAGVVSTFSATANSAEVRNVGLRDGGKIGGLVWIDKVVAAGTKDAGDAVYTNGAVINLLDSSGAVISTTTTKTTDGTYLFTELNPASYYIQLTQPTGYKFTNRATTPTTAANDSDVDASGTNTGRTDSLTISDPRDATPPVTVSIPSYTNNANFGTNITIGLQPVNIGDSIWLDVNGNGIQDPTETMGIGGATVTLKKGCTFTNGVPSGCSDTLVGTDLFDPNPIASTDPYTQNYGFSGVVAGTGTYWVEVKLPSTDYAFSPYVVGGIAATNNSKARLVPGSNPPTAYITVTGYTVGSINTQWDAGAYRKNTIVGRVWDDTVDGGNTISADSTKAGDGLWKVGEPGIANVKVYLCNGSNTSTCVNPIVSSGALTNTTTDASGNYQFPGLIPGQSYYIKVVSPDGYGIGTKWAAGATDADTKADDSDFNADTNQTDLIALNQDALTKQRDAGLYKLGSVGNLVWEDFDPSSPNAATNFNGIQDPLEKGIPGVNVTLLLQGSNKVFKTTTTDDNGNYKIPNIPYGTYQISYTLKSGSYIFVKPNQGTGTNAYKFDSDATPLSTKPTVGISATVKVKANQDRDDIDAGAYKVAEVGNWVWEDSNGNGIQDADEGGLANVSVELNGTSPITKSAVGLATKTNAHGYYTFTNLTPLDKATLTFNLPTGYYFTKKKANYSTSDTDSDVDPTTATATKGTADAFTLAYGVSQLNWDAGMYKQAVITGTAWEDLDANSIRETKEVTGLAKLKVYLLDENGNLASTVGGSPNPATTNATGFYSFTVAPGDYILKFDKSSLTGYNFSTVNQAPSTITACIDTTPCSTQISLASGGNQGNKNVGLYRNVTISGETWEDKNGNGLYDLGEGVVAGIKVQLLYSDGTAVPPTSISGTTPNPVNTNATGVYSFTVKPGSYKLKFSIPTTTGYFFTLDNAGSDDNADSDANPSTGESDSITLDSGQDQNDWDAGVYKPGVIGNLVWEDLNANGLQDAGEKGVRDVPVKLYQRKATGKDEEIGATSTNSTGVYSFTVTPSTYTVEVVLPTGYSFSPMGTTPSETNSDVYTKTGRTKPIALLSGIITNTWDAGIYRFGTVGNFIWEDINYNGIQDPGEAGIKGVKVSLLSGSTIVTKTVSDQKGLYSLSAKPGSYTVVVSAPLGYTFSPAFKGTIDNDNNFVASATSPFSATASVILKSGLVTDTVDAGLAFAEVLINGSSDVIPTLSVVEGGKTDSYKVRLSAPPSGSVEVKSNDGSKQLTLTPATLTFDATNWNQDQTVSVVAIDDKKPESLVTALITHTVTSADPNYSNADSPNVQVQVTDNDKPVAYLVQSAASTIVKEGSLDKGGFNDTYALKLQFAPTADVLISLTPIDSQITVTPTQLTFTPSNWAKQQIVMVSAVDDNVIEGLHNSAVLHTVTSSDAIFNGGYIQEPSFNIYSDGNPLPVFVEDDDSKVNVSPLKLHLAEGGASATYQVSLSGSPTADVTIFPFPFDQPGIVQSTGQITFTPSSLTFSPGNASISQTVTVSAIDNNIIEGTHAGAIFHKVIPTSAADQDFMGTTGVANGVYVLIDDNDSLVQFSPTSLELAEGGPAKTYQVQLKSSDVYGPPTKNVVLFTSTDGQVTLNPTKLTFTPENYGVPQIVTLSAVDDTLLEGLHEGTVLNWLSSEDSHYVQNKADLVVATIKDNDNSPDLQLAKSDGGLKAQPGRPITYTLTYTNAGYMDASGTVIIEKVPAYTSFSSSGSSTGWSCENDGVAGSACSYRLGILPVEGQGKLTFTVLVTSTLPDSALYIVNTANITSDAEFDGNLVDNTASVTSTISQLRILVTDEGQSVKPGGVLRYTIHYTNTGSGIAQNVKIKIPVPANTTFNSSQSGPGLAALPGVWEHADGTPCANGDPTGTTCIYLVPPKGSLGPGQSGIVYFAVTVNSTLPTGINKIAVEAEISDDTTSNKGLSEDETIIQATPVGLNVYLPFIAKNIPYTPPTTPTPSPTLTPTPTPVPTTVVENPDLVVSSVSLNPNKKTFSAGEAVEISVVVTNQGKGTAAPFWVDLYLNPNTPPTAANVRWNQTCGTSNSSYCFGLAWQITQTLQAGQSITLKSLATGNGHFDVDSSRWQGWFANGTTDLYVYADSWNPTVVYGANQEADETNNRAELHNLVVTGTNPPAGGGSASSANAPR